MNVETTQMYIYWLPTREYSRVGNFAKRQLINCIQGYWVMDEIRKNDIMKIYRKCADAVKGLCAKVSCKLKGVKGGAGYEDV